MTRGTGLLLVVSVLVVLGAGAAAFVLTGKPHGAMQIPPPPANQPPATPGMPQPLPAAPMMQPPPPSPAGQMEPAVHTYSLIRDSAAYTAPSLDAPQLYALRAGTGVVAVSRSRDGAWVMALTQDGQPACIPAGDLGPYDPAKTPVLDHVDGAAVVLDTATIQIDDVKIPLAGVIGKSGDYAAKLQAGLSEQGASLHCVRTGAAYVCTTPGGTDVARAALYNGLALPAPDATEDYKKQALAAQAARRGVWQ
jgi:hypothetical protein